MKILVDTNILISAILYPRSKPAEAFVYIAENHEMVLCSQNLAELREVLNEKAPQALPDAELLLKELPYELIPVDSHTQRMIRDPADFKCSHALWSRHYINRRQGLFESGSETSQVHECSAVSGDPGSVGAAFAAVDFFVSILIGLLKNFFDYKYVILYDL